MEHVLEDRAGILPEGAESEIGPGPPSHAGSLLDHLRATRQEIAQRKTRQVQKTIPGWEGALAVIYRYPEAGSDPIIKAVERAQRGGKPSDVLDANADVLIACCHDIVARKPGEDWGPLDESDPDTPLRFGSRLAGLLGITVADGIKSPARFILRNVFSPAAATTGVYEGDVALMVQAGQIITWLQGAEGEVDEALAGE